MQKATRRIKEYFEPMSADNSYFWKVVLYLGRNCHETCKATLYSQTRCDAVVSFQRQNQCDTLSNKTTKNAFDNGWDRKEMKLYLFQKTWYRYSVCLRLPKRGKFTVWNYFWRAYMRNGRLSPFSCVDSGQKSNGPHTNCLNSSVRAWTRTVRCRTLTCWNVNRSVK